MTQTNPTPINPSIKKAQRVLSLGIFIVLGILIGVFISPRTQDHRDCPPDMSTQAIKAATTDSAILHKSIAARNMYVSFTVLAITLSCCAVLITSVVMADYYRKEEGKSHE